MKQNVLFLCMVLVSMITSHHSMSAAPFTSPPATLYLIGYLETDVPNFDGVEFTRDGNIYTCEATLIRTNGFNSLYFTYEHGEANNPLTGGFLKFEGNQTLLVNGAATLKVYAASGSGINGITITEGGRYSFVFNAGEGTLSVAKLPDVIEEPKLPEELYLIGYFDGDFIDYDGIEFKRNGDDYLCENVEIITRPEQTNYLYFTFTRGENNNPLAGPYLEFSNAAKGVIELEHNPETFEVSPVVVHDGTANALVITEDGKYDFKYDSAGGTLTVTKTMGTTTDLDVAAVKDCLPTYYTLQGLRVRQPKNGYYIEVKGGKANVIFVK